jgi:hypothetical protein
MPRVTKTAKKISKWVYRHKGEGYRINLTVHFNDNGKIFLRALTPDGKTTDRKLETSIACDDGDRLLAAFSECMREAKKEVARKRV